jgi:hypothetical protein
VLVTLQFSPHFCYFLLDSNVLLSTLFWNTHDLCSSFNVRWQVSHPYKTAGKIIVLHNLIFTILISRWKHNILN